MNEELELEKLNDLAIHYPVYLIDAAAEHFNSDECKLEAKVEKSSIVQWQSYCKRSNLA